MLMGMFYIILMYLYDNHMDYMTFYICISAWASALLVQTVMGNAKASECGTSSWYRFLRLFRVYRKVYST